ncbi:DUF6452 family protein [Lutibacter holmesii]|uniref:DUF6452 family protein n=1 Tax=Lutibacter holmesii TaxID=1137985 RepID=A0ABW3WLC9_9FLAO
MKKSLLLIIISLFAITSCEQDDICIDATTPFLLIRFNDYEDQDEYKSVTLDSVWAQDQDLYLTSSTVDSLYIPLDLNEDVTLYNLAANAVVDEMNLNYNRSDIFVGRSCGYKTIFEDLELESNTNNWIKNIEFNYTTIDNDTIAAITIFH